MDKSKDKQGDELLNRIRNELTAILAENASNDPQRKISYEMIMKPTPLPTLEPTKKTKASKKTVVSKRPHTYRQAVSGKSITMKPSQERLLSSPDMSSSSGTSATSFSQLPSHLPNLDHNSAKEFVESASSKSMDEDLQKMQLELGQSYKLFQGIGEKFESINFGGLKTRIRDLHLNKMTNDLGKVQTVQLQKMFESSYMQNRLDKLTADVSLDFSRHPGEFGDIPELSSFFQACAQLEHGLDTLKQQRKRSSELEKRLCWATEIAYDRMEEIRNSVGNKPETNF